MSATAIYGEAIKTAIEQEYSYAIPTMDQQTAERKITDSTVIGSFFLWQDSATRECHFTGIGSQGEIHHARLTKDAIQWTAENYNTITTSLLPHAIAGVLGSPKIYPVMPKGMENTKPTEQARPQTYDVRV